MSEKGKVSLEGIIKEGQLKYVSLVIIGTDKAVLNDYSKEIEKICCDNNIQYTFDKNVEIVSKYAIAISWRWIIEAKENKLIVLHDSLLPKYRGFSPLVSQLLNEETNIGVTALFAVEKYDEGDILKQNSVQIDYPIKIGEAIRIISLLYSDTVTSVISGVINNTLTPTKQDDALSSYSLWRNEDDYLIDWNKTSKEIRRFIDALGSPYLGASCYIKDKKVIIIEAEEIKDVIVENRTAGKVLYYDEGLPVVVCVKGLLKIKEGFYEEDSKSIFPLKSFRTIFKSTKSI